MKPPAQPVDLSEDVVLPTDLDELARCLADPVWRICSGIYKILVKGDDDDEGTILNFRPNRAQRRFIARLWHRNLILKARQLGFTTLACILWLDHALFNKNQRCGIVAHDRDSAANIFRDKVKFAYEHLPQTLKDAIPVVSNNASEILFANNSSIRVATSMRSGTIHRLHISEYGKICARYPHKAKEVMTGSLPAVPSTGITIIESTAEGMDGDFYKKSTAAQAQHEKGHPLTVKDFRFHFYAWWQEPKYRMDPKGVVLLDSDEYGTYFEEVEGIIKQKLDREQRAWYVATKEIEFSADDETMWREYPSYPEEAFKVSTEGAYFAKQLSRARIDGRITTVPYMPGYPVHTFWDLGLNDLQTLWFMQHIGVHHRFIRYHEAEGEGVSYYARYLQDTGYVFGSHYIPHDGAARKPALEKPETYEDLLRKANLKSIIVVPRITHKTTAIDMLRDQFGQCWFDEKNCSVGLKRLQNYKKEWNERLQTWGEQPRHDDNSNAADSLMQYAQGYKGTPAARRRQRKTNWRTA